MVTLAVGVILLSIAVPPLSAWISKNTVNAVATTVVGTLQQARSEAIKHNGRVLVCASNAAGTDCATTTATNWGTAGWLICADQDGDASCDPSTSALPNPIRREGAINATQASVIGPNSPIRFNSTGNQGDIGGGTVTVTITGAGQGATPLAVTVAASGLVKGARTP